MATEAAYIDLVEGAAPATPGTGIVRVYAKTDALAYQKDDAGTETGLAGGGGSAVATDAIWDAAGDTLVGTGANTAARLAIGAAATVLTSNGTTASWAVPIGAWQTYTPTWTASTTNPTLGDGTLEGRYKMLDASTALVEISLILGGTTNIGSGTYSFALPVTASATPSRQVLAGYFLDAGTAFYVASGQVVASTATVALVVVADSAGTRIWTSGNPNVLGATDEMVLSGIIKV